jgi:Flp pilus assembly protein TadD
MTPTLLRWSPLLAAALASLAFLPALGASFVNWDDEVSFLRNPHYRGLGPAQLRWMWTTTLLGHWSPLAWMSWGADYVIGGLDPRGYHLTSLLVHAANVALLCLVARRLIAAGIGTPPSSTAVGAGAVLAALLFGVHPLRAESVAWVSERRDLLAALFALTATLAYLRGVAPGAPIAPGGGLSHASPIALRWWALSVAAFAGALMSKALAMTLPLTLLLLDVYPLRRRALGGRTLLIEKAPYLLLAAAAGTVAFLTRQGSGNITEYTQHGLEARIALAAYTFWFYPWKSLWPTGLAAMYELPATVRLAEPRFLVALVGVVVVTLVLVARRRRWPAALTAWASSVIALAPVSGLVHSGNQLAADRYSYLSSLGLAVLAGAALTWSLWHARAVPVVATAAAVVVVALAAGAWTQTTTWRDSESLWRRAVAVDSACSICESNLGRVIAGPARLDEAEGHVRRAIALRGDRPGPRENLGMILLMRGRLPEAEAAFRESLRLRPQHGPAHNDLGVVLANAGRDAEAEAAFREAVRLSPRLADALANLGLLYVRQGRHEDAIGVLQRALALDPTRRDARRWLAQSYEQAGRSAEAARENAALAEGRR